MINHTDTDKISDGYHTFGELYAHRTALFLCLLAETDDDSVGFSLHHHPDDAPVEPGFLLAWLIAWPGMISYHFRIDPWLAQLRAIGIPEYGHAPKWDGHTANDVLRRVIQYAGSQ